LMLFFLSISLSLSPQLSRVVTGESPRGWKLGRGNY